MGIPEAFSFKTFTTKKKKNNNGICHGNTPAKLLNFKDSENTVLR